MSLKQYTSENPMAKLAVGGLVGMGVGTLISIILHITDVSIATNIQEIGDSIITSDAILNLIVAKARTVSLNEVRIAITCIFSFFGMALGVIGGAATIAGIYAIISALKGAILGFIMFAWIGAASVVGTIVSAIVGAAIGGMVGAILEVLNYLDANNEVKSNGSSD